MAIPLPPRAEIDRVVDEVERKVSLAADTTAQIGVDHKRIARLRQSILKWAFEGKLVDQDPNDEPASILLERIRKEREAAAPTKRQRRAKKPPHE